MSNKGDMVYIKIHFADGHKKSLQIVAHFFSLKSKRKLLGTQNVLLETSVGLLTNICQRHFLQYIHTLQGSDFYKD